MGKFTEAQNVLLRACKNADFEVGLSLEIGLTCVQDKHALKMAKFIREHPNLSNDEMYVDKAYEIIGEPRPEYYVDSKRV